MNKDMKKSTTVDRQKRIVEILTLLHEGGSFEEAKKIFNEEFDGVDVSEITGAEKALIQGGLNPSEIQKLCNVHAAVFKGSIKDIHKSSLEENTPGHPVHTLKLENQVIASLLNDEIRWVFAKIEKGDWKLLERLLAALEDLYNIDKHYTRKETLIFSYMEKYGITAPPKVMWGVDDAVRDMIKELLVYLKTGKVALNPLREMLDDVITEIEEMIFKEEAIMIPMCLDVFSLDDWEQIERDSSEIGYSFIAEPLKWKASSESRALETEREPERLAAIESAKAMTAAIAADGGAEIVKPKCVKRQYDWEKAQGDGVAVLPTGIMHLNELTALFNVLPVDLSFVDKDDIVRFFSGGERIFPRAKSVVGRRVIDCHPPKSFDAVDKILKDFHAGIRDSAEFWIDLHRFNKKVYIRYFAMRDEETGEYLGCLEVSQDITAIQNLVGEKRLDGHEQQHSAYEDAVAEKTVDSNAISTDEKLAASEMPDFVKKMLEERSVSIDKR
ncbi:MAG: DUF438 domain-containing protein [Streptococcaceae bacterium]|nr:DUF438 domain-containing protein [Streptococcaceae bacterium]